MTARLRLVGLIAALALSALPASAFAQVGPQTLQPSSNWAAYVGGNGYYTGVSALVQAPQPAALQTLGVVSSWVGIGGAQSHDLIQAGVQEVNQGPFVSYNAWYELLPEVSRNLVMDIQPGAWVSVDVHEMAYDRFQITIVNGANVFQRQFTYQSSHSSAEWVVEEPAVLAGRMLRLLPLAGVTGANFARMSSIVNGHPALPVQLSPMVTAIVGEAGQVKAGPSPLGADGASFNVSTFGL